MSRILAFLLMALLPMTVAEATQPVLVVHGGAGVIRAGLTPQKDRAVRADLDAALKAGYAVLEAGVSSLDAVSREIVVLED
jgi:beta-aspartyl-peptidase (threonine type)